MRKKVVMFTCLTALVLSLPPVDAASDPARGTASTSISLARLSFTSPTSTSAADVTTTVDVGAGSGFATSDPVRNSLDRMKAFFNLVAASTAGVTQVATPSFDAKAEGDSSPSSDSKADGSQPITTESLLAGGVTLTALSAHVDPRSDAVSKSPSARASLGDGLINLDVGAGLVNIDSVHVGISTLVDTARADAIQGIEVGSIEILPLGQLLSRVGGLDPSAVADQLVALAGSFGGPAVQTAAAAVTAERDQTLADINACLAGVDPVECVPLSALGLGGLPSSMSVQGLLDYPANFAAMCTSLLSGLGALADAVCADVIPVVAATTASLPGLLQALLDELAPQAVLSVQNLVAKVSAHATDVTSTAVATGGWDSAVVLGNDLAGVTETADPGVALDRIDLELAKLVDLLDDFPSLAGLTIQLDPLFKEPVTGVDGTYRTARSQLSVLRLLVQMPAVSVAKEARAAGFRAAGVGDPFTLDARAVTLSGYAEHRAGGASRPGACATNCLAASGPPSWSLRWMGGFILLAIGSSLRRWLRDAA